MKIDQHLISHLPYLAALYRHQSFTGAAASLFVSQAAMTYQIKKLEDKLHCQLVVRRAGSQLHFTADGENLVKAYLWCEKRLNLAIDNIDHQHGRGTLKMSAPIDLGSMVMPKVIAKIKQQAPALEIELHSSDDCVSLDEGHWDMAIRSHLGPLDLPVFSSPITLVASASYADRIKSLDGLEQHTVLLRQNSNHSSWQNLLGQPPAFSKTLTFGNTLGMREAAKEALGFALLPRFVVAKELQSGELVQFLPQVTEGLNVNFQILAIEGAQIESYKRLLQQAFQAL